MRQIALYLAIALSVFSSPVEANVGNGPERFTGFYAGVNGGGIFASNVRWYNVVNPRIGSKNLVGWLAGGTLGLNHCAGECMIFGIEVDGDCTGIDKKGPPRGTYAYDRVELEALITARGRIGYVIDSSYDPMLFITGGLAAARATFSSKTNAGVIRSAKQWRVGYTAGGGIEFFPSECNDYTVKVEYLFIRFSEEDHALARRHFFSSNFHVARLGLNFVF